MSKDVLSIKDKTKRAEYFECVYFLSKLECKRHDKTGKFSI